MTTLKLDENYSVQMDAYNFTLKSEFKKFDEVKQKEITTKNEWHFPYFKLAIDKYMNECLKPCENIIQIQKELLRIEQLILNLK